MNDLIAKAIVEALKEIVLELRRMRRNQQRHFAWVRDQGNEGGNGGGAPEEIIVRTLPSATNLHFIAGFDLSCIKKDPSAVPDGKPKTDMPPIGNNLGDRTRYPPGTLLKIQGRAAISCIDDPSTKTVLGAGMEPFNVVIDVRAADGTWGHLPPNPYGPLKDYLQLLCRQVDVEELQAT